MTEDAYHGGGGVTASQLEGDLQELKHHLTLFKPHRPSSYIRVQRECCTADHQCDPDANKNSQIVL